jgi:hypothetical protein
MNTRTVISFVLKRPYFLALCWAIIIFALCATPGQYIPSADWMGLLSIDKLVHATMFFVLLALLMIGSFKIHSNGLIPLFFLLSIAYGWWLEYMQSHYFSSRSQDWKDTVANALGCVVAVLLIRKIRSFVIINSGV